MSNDVSLDSEQERSLIFRLLSKLADIALWNDASKACFISLGIAHAFLLFSLWFWAHSLIAENSGYFYIPLTIDEMVKAAQICFVFSVGMLLVSVVATYCVLKEKYYPQILYFCMLFLAFTHSIVFAMIGLFDGVSWLFILIYTATGMVFLKRREVFLTGFVMVLLMVVWSFIHTWLPFEVRAYQFTNEISISSMSGADLGLTWLVIIFTFIFCSLLLDILMGAWHNREQDLHHKSYRDELTSLLNRRAIQDGLKEEFFRAKRGEYELSIAIVDIDHFKKINDNYGHPFGDKVLKLLSAKMSEVIRKKDLLGRYGGEEFLIVFPECDKEQAYKIMERLREGTESQVMHTLKGEEVSITLSAGIAELDPDDKMDELISRADKAVYQAKNDGRNKVVYG